MIADLLERLEKCEGRDLYLEADLLLTLFRGDFPDKYRSLKFNPTASLDAVLALVEEKLPGWGWLIQHGGGDRLALAALTEPRDSDGLVPEWPSRQASAPTPALALLKALLLALSRQGGGK